jgi:outer membrane protein OmpA-like peptidoglycan-associated protein
MTALATRAFRSGTTTPSPSTSAAVEPPVTAPAVTHTSVTEPAPPPSSAPGRDTSLSQLTTLPLSFAKNSADFEITDAAQFDELIATIKRDLGTSMLEVGGHTSTEGSERVNEELSLKRAANVKRYLVSHGIPEDHTVLRDYKTSAVGQAPAQQANRRVTVRVLK